uniref:Uncharacterized protein n=1 Tax=Oryza sativa subsp. japonica TaxID=39947 RepID=Q2QT99_ORYSJ|nr:hypothetical protein LOC_Os12g20380 [Oryza sativa Japonica Group]
MKTGAGEDLASGSVRGDGGSGGGRERPHGQRWTAAAAAHREDLVSGGGGWGRRRLRATDGDLRPAAVDGEAPAVGRPRLSFSARRRRKGTTTPGPNIATLVANKLLATLCLPCHTYGKLSYGNVRQQPNRPVIFARSSRVERVKSCGGDGWTIIEQEIKSDPIQELRKETRESQNHKKTGATAHIRGKHAAAPRSWRLGERPTVRRKEDVIAEALTGRGCLHCAGEDNDAAEERAPPAEGRASPAEGGRRRRARVLLAAVGRG